jgi:hypothetical protein
LQLSGERARRHSTVPRSRWLRGDTPLARLTATQVALVLHADGLQELIGVQVGADIETI